ncbi:MAG: 5-formyltetrahydrofolate cyclo-ligase [Gammaproteobacteria bacterium]|nr:5-formyltetrahydrofolate cyclo-ligase [Gammaproteobacteria bacterium]
MNEESRQALRDSLRQARQALTPKLQNQANQAVCDLLQQQDFFRAAEHIAFYQAFDGEIDPKPLLDLALSQGKHCYLPIIAAGNPDMLSFAPFDKNTILVKNNWGIPEPLQPTELVPPTHFDLVLVPLVGFDQNCFRLGMGKGFYDRTFSFKIFNRSSNPLLIGLAHANQLLDAFPTQSWDVRLDAVITAEKIFRPDAA